MPYPLRLETRVSSSERTCRFVCANASHEPVTADIVMMPFAVAANALLRPASMTPVSFAATAVVELVLEPPTIQAPRAHALLSYRRESASALENMAALADAVTASEFEELVRLPPESFASKRRNDVAIFIQSACHRDQSQRHRLFRALAQHVPVAYYGGMHRYAGVYGRKKYRSCEAGRRAMPSVPRARPPSGRRLLAALSRVESALYKAKLYNLAQVRFFFAFENSMCRDYHTEKIFHALLVGCVPVYLGAPSIVRLFPRRAFIDVADFASVAELGAHLRAVAENASAYESYLRWRSEPEAIERFRRLFARSKSDATLRLDDRLCRRLLALEPTGVEYSVATECTALNESFWRE